MKHYPQTDQEGRKAACQDVHRSASIRLADPASLQLGKGRVWHPEFRVQSRVFFLLLCFWRFFGFFVYERAHNL